MNKNTGKLVIVIICLAVAGFLIASQMGLLGGGSAPKETKATAPEGTATEATEDGHKKAEFPANRR